MCFAFVTLLSLQVFFSGPAAMALDLSGSWSGNWSSGTTRHRGPLRCTFTKLDETSYQADFSGRFFKVLPFRYSVVLTVIADTGDSITLSGSHELGRRFGTFTYTATATCTDFVANYSSCKDNGQFTLSRCCGF
jgi:hypothetical protein